MDELPLPELSELLELDVPEPLELLEPFELDEELLEPFAEAELLEELLESESSSSDAPTLETTSTSSSVSMESFGETTMRRLVSPCWASTFTTVPMIRPRA